MIEPHNWKRLSASRYAVLTRNNVEQWLDQHQGKSIAGLKVEAASTSLARAQRDFESSGSAESRDMIQFYRDRLVELGSPN